MARQLSAEEVKEIQALFDSIDLNHDGRITLKELAKHMVERTLTIKPQPPSLNLHNGKKIMLCIFIHR